MYVRRKRVRAAMITAGRIAARALEGGLLPLGDVTPPSTGVRMCAFN